MNNVNLLGRLTADPEIRNGSSTLVARYTLAVNRGKDEADFISCVAFGKSAEFAEKYLKKGMQIGITGSIRTGSYVNKEGVKVYTTDVVVYQHDFASAKSSPEEWHDIGLDNVPFA